MSAKKLVCCRRARTYCLESTSALFSKNGDYMIFERVWSFGDKLTPRYEVFMRRQWRRSPNLKSKSWPCSLLVSKTMMRFCRSFELRFKVYTVQCFERCRQTRNVNHEKKCKKVKGEVCRKIVPSCYYDISYLMHYSQMVTDRSRVVLSLIRLGIFRELPVFARAVQK